MVTAQEVYGVDLQLIDKDLVLSPSGGFNITSGNDNVRQALMNRLSTETNSLVYNKNYGVSLAMAIGEKNTYIKQQVIKTLILSAVKQDPRITSVISIDVELDSQHPDTYYINLEVVPIGNNAETININFVYPYYLNQTNVKIDAENETSLDKTTVMTAYDIYSINGIWLATDVNKTGVNYYQGTNSSFLGRVIYLAYELPSVSTDVIVGYNKKVESNIGGV